MRLDDSMVSFTAGRIVTRYLWDSPAAHDTVAVVLPIVPPMSGVNREIRRLD